MDPRNDGRAAIGPSTQPPSCRLAARRYLQHRAGPGAKAELTVTGETPGISAYADMIDRSCRVFDWRFHVDMTIHYAAKLRAELAESTYATRISQLREFTKWCINRGWGISQPVGPDFDPWSDVHVPKPMPTLFRRLTAEELLRILEAAPYPRDRIALALAMNTGLRGKEIADLRVRDVDLKNRRLHVRITKTREIDAMPITADLELELRRWLQHYGEMVPLGKGFGVDDEAFLVPAQHVSGPTITYKPLVRLGEPHTVVARAIAKAGLPAERDGFHTIRRSIARIYFDMIEDESSEDRALIATMTLLHHSKPETTLRYIGVDRQKEYRDDALQGRRFLTKLAGEHESVSGNTVTELRRFG